MKQFFLALIARIRGTHAVDAVIADFNKALVKLQAVADHHEALFDIHDETVRIAQEARAAAGAEAERARQIASRFKELVS